MRVVALAAPALAVGLTVATWLVWGVGSLLLVLVGASLHLLVAAWRRRPGSLATDPVPVAAAHAWPVLRLVRVGPGLP